MQSEEYITDVVIETSTFNFFVANCNKIDNLEIVTNINLDKIVSKKYNFGIILNKSIKSNNDIFGKINCPLYSLNDIPDRYEITVIHRPESIPEFESRYHLLFINISLLQNYATGEKYLKWLYERLSTISKTAAGIFIISLTTPFHYLLWDKNNLGLGKLMRILFIFNSNNLYFISADKDYMNLVRVFENDFDEKYGCLEFLLVGQINTVTEYPVIFNKSSYQGFCDKYNYLGGIIDKNSGYLGISCCCHDRKISIIFEKLSFTDISRKIIHNVMRIIENTQMSKPTFESMYSLVMYKQYIIDNDFIEVYRSTINDKNQKKFIMKHNILDNIIPAIDEQIDKYYQL
jgi:hypothetical protein